MELPDNLIAGTLNSKRRRKARGLRGKKIPRIHVSSLIKSGASDFFCEREFVLNHIEDREKDGGGLPPKFELLFGVGHFYGEYIVQKFLERNPLWAKYAWGNWTCPCKETTIERINLPTGMKCATCTKDINIYVEVDLFNPAKTVVGHADLIFNVDGYFFIYEFKSMERADVDFDTLEAPLGDHIVQASNYREMLRSEGKKVSSRLRFVYVDRSMAGLYTQDPFKELYAQTIKTERLARFYKKSKVVHQSFETKVLPGRRCKTITCGRATTCQVAVSCFERTKKRFKDTR
jgi:hypothetical protein